MPQPNNPQPDVVVLGLEDDTKWAVVALQARLDTLKKKQATLEAAKGDSPDILDARDRNKRFIEDVQSEINARSAKKGKTK
jgi:hypothetical protein